MTFDPMKLTAVMNKLASPGELTTEYAAFKSASFWQKVTLAVGLLVLAGSAVAEALGTDSRWGMGIGAGIAVIAKVLNFLQVLGYGSQRADVKVAASDAASVILGPPTPDADAK